MSGGAPAPVIVAAAIRDAIADLPTPAYRGVALRSIGATLAIVAVVWAIGTRVLTGWADQWAATHPVDVPMWLTSVQWVAGLLSGAMLMVGLTFLIAPITTAIAGLFLDEVAEATERRRYPHDPVGTPIPFLASLGQAARVTVLSILVNLVCLALLLVPGINLVAFFLGNGWLIGREYFDFAARRLMSAEEARRLRASNGATALLAGLAAAVVLAVPILNLTTPLVATAIMVHAVKRATGSRPVDAAR